MRCDTQQLSDDTLHLKAKVRKLVKRAGGVEAAADLTRVSKSNLSNYANPNRNVHVPVDVLLDLERDAHDPIVTRALASLQGYVLLKVAATGEDAELLRDALAIGAGAGEVFAEVEAALADDGQVDARERARIEAKVDRLMECLATAKAHLRPVQDADADAPCAATGEAG